MIERQKAIVREMDISLTDFHWLSNERPEMLSFYQWWFTTHRASVIERENVASTTALWMELFRWISLDSDAIQMSAIHWRLIRWLRYWSAKFIVRTCRAEGRSESFLEDFQKVTVRKVAKVEFLEND